MRFLSTTVPLAHVAMLMLYHRDLRESISFIGASGYAISVRPRRLELALDIVAQQLGTLH